MRIVTRQQGTPEWYAARRGCITASEVTKVLMKETTKGFKNYLQEKVMDLQGIPDFSEEDDPPWFRHGKEFEDQARLWYQFDQDTVLTQTGFVLHEGYGWLGMSPDGLSGTWSTEAVPHEYDVMRPIDGGLVEMKVRQSLATYHEHVAKISRPTSDQLQCQLIVSGAPWVDYFNYYRNNDHQIEKGSVQRIYRDEVRIEYIIERCLVFRRLILATVMEQANGKNDEDQTGSGARGNVHQGRS
jgi:hypothetical protein